MARRQHGVVVRRDLEGLGFTEEAIEHRLATGRLHLISAGVYAVGRPELTPTGRWMAAVLACGDGAVLSHRSAAELWGIGWEEPGRIDVTIRRRSGLERRGIKVRCRPSLGAGSLTRWRGIPVTHPIQTMIDLATELKPIRLERVVNEADKLDLVDPETLRKTLDLHKGEPGVKKLATLLDRHTFRLSDSDLAPRRATFALSGLPSSRPAASSTARRGAATPSGLRPCRPRRLLRQNRATVVRRGAILFRPGYTTPPDQAGQGRRERGVLSTRAIEDADMRRSGGVVRRRGTGARRGRGSRRRPRRSPDLPVRRRHAGRRRRRR